jgi:flagellar basal-body rod protein FlgB
MPISLSNADALTRLIDATEVRHAVISQNIANVNTPYYRARELDFEAELARQLDSRAAGAVTKTEAAIVYQTGLAARTDGNNVDLDREVGQLSQNALLHQTYTQVLGNYYDALRRAMRVD